MSTPTIEHMPLPENNAQRLRQRCSRLVESGGTAHFDGQQNRCARHARFRFYGIPLCGQHAGEAALKTLMKGNSNE